MHMQNNTVSLDAFNVGVEDWITESDVESEDEFIERFD